MSVVRKLVSMPKEDAEFLENNSISLSKFVQRNIEKIRTENRSASNPERVSVTPFGG